jgi:hypothetical protein
MKLALRVLTLVSIATTCLASFAVGQPPPSGTPVPGVAAQPAAPPASAAVVNSKSPTWIFDDASDLAALLKDKDKNKANEAWGLLAGYGVTQDNLKDNPFLKRVKSLAAPEKVELRGGMTLVNPQASTPSNPFSPSSVADALGTIIAERFKQEAELVALQNLAREMKRVDSSFTRRPIKAALPQSVAYLDSLAQLGNVESFEQLGDSSITFNDWTVLQSDFKSDLSSFSDNVGPFVDAIFPATKTKTRLITRVAMTVGYQATKTGRSPYVIVDEIQKACDDFQDDKNSEIVADDQAIVAQIDNTANLLALLSHMFTKNGKDAWRTSREIGGFLTAGDDNVWLLAGLSYAKDKAIYDRVKTTLPTLTDKMSALLTTAQNGVGKLEALMKDFDKLRTDAGGLQTVSGVAPTANALLPLVTDFVSVGTDACDTLLVFDPKANEKGQVDTIEADLKKIEQGAKTVVLVIGDVYAKRYASAVGDTIVLLTVDLKPYLPEASGVTRFLNTHGPFLAAVASASSSADLKSALDAYALPVGSYSAKQHSPFSITLNAYFGGHISREWLSLNATDPNANSPWGYSAGLSAPVGIDLNWGQQSKKVNKSNTGSWSLFLPILDVGAVASWRLQGGSGQVSDLTWSNIIAPGAFVVWTLKSTPFAAMVGAQYGPELRKISTGGANTIERAAVQFPVIGLTFDIPLFNLYQRPVVAK